MVQTNQLVPAHDTWLMLEDYKGIIEESEADKVQKEGKVFREAAKAVANRWSLCGELTISCWELWKNIREAQ